MRTITITKPKNKAYLVHGLEDFSIQEIQEIQMILGKYAFDHSIKLEQEQEFLMLEKEQ